MHQVIQDQAEVQKLSKNIQEGDIYVFKKAIQPSLVHSIREYLVNVGRSSLPNYQAIEEGCPNYHRVNQWDKRSYVEACFHQFAFFPWNQDVFNFFELSRPIYGLRNLLTGLPADKFMSGTPQDGCIARIAFQFYPSGSGGMNKHKDPYDHHQLTVPILTMSEKGKDFQTGGCFVEDADGKRIYVDEISEIGDAVYFNSQTAHGVEMIDKDEKLDWLSFKGRWMMLFAVNKLAGNSQIADAQDLEKVSAGVK
jgi:hypothetical protein